MPGNSLAKVVIIVGLERKERKAKQNKTKQVACPSPLPATTGKKRSSPKVQGGAGAAPCGIMIVVVIVSLSGAQEQKGG